MSYLHLLELAAPEAILTATALLVLFLDLGGLRGRPLPARMRIAALLSAFGCVAAGAWICWWPEMGRAAEGIFAVEPLGQLVKLLILGLTLCTALLSAESDFTEHVGEYFALILFATVGMLFLVSTEHLLMLFAALELTSLSLYVLTAFNKRDPKSAEAALKYFLFGGMAAAFALFGLSLVYGVSGSVVLPEIARKLAGQGMDPLLMVALVMVVAGFGFKVAAVPFHLWAPDAYEGAPTPSAALIASGSKVASFYVLAKVMFIGFAEVAGSAAWGGFETGWMPLLALLAVLSMVLGNLAALAQSNVKRLLAYSAIAHAGYALLGVLADNEEGLVSVLYYMATYGLSVIGAFGVVAVVERAGGVTFQDFTGLSRRAPSVALCLMIFILSLAGVPPLAGFLGKFLLFAAAAKSGVPLALLWLVILGLAMSCVSLYYYLLVLKHAFVTKPAADTLPLPSLEVSFLTRVVLGVLALAVLVLGAMPDLLLGWLQVAAAGFPVRMATGYFN